MNESQAQRDRRMVVDFLHHADEDVEAAAQRLADSADPADRTLGQEWLRTRRSN